MPVELQINNDFENRKQAQTISRLKYSSDQKRMILVRPDQISIFVFIKFDSD